MILRKVGIGLIGLMFMLSLAVTTSYAQRGRYCRTGESSRYYTSYDRGYRGRARYLNARYRAPRYYTTVYSPRRYASTRYVRYRSPRYYTTSYAPRYYTEYPRYTSYRRYPRNGVSVSLNFGW